MVPSDGPQFGQLSQKRPSQHRTHAGDAPQERLVVLEGAARLDRFVEVPISALDLLLQPPNVGSDAPGDRLRGHLGAVTLGDAHRRELAPPGEYGLQGEGFFIGQDAGLRTHGSGEAGEDFCVDSVSLGEASGGLGVVASLAGVDHGYGDSGYGDSGCRDGSSGALVAPAGLQDDQLGGCLFEPLDEGVDSLLVVGECESLALGHQADSRRSLETSIPTWRGLWGLVALMALLLPLPMCPALQIRARQ